MAIQMLDFGYPQSMVQNQIYALPPNGVILLTETTGLTFQTANDVAFTNPVNAIPGGGGATIARAFIRCTTANAVVGVSRNA